MEVINAKLGRQRKNDETNFTWRDYMLSNGLIRDGLMTVEEMQGN